MKKGGFFSFRKTRITRHCPVGMMHTAERRAAEEEQNKRQEAAQATTATKQKRETVAPSINQSNTNINPNPNPAFNPSLGVLLFIILYEQEKVFNVSSWRSAWIFFVFIYLWIAQVNL